MKLALSWCERLRARTDAPPLRPRVPLAWRGERIGSVEREFVETLVHPLLVPAGEGFNVAGDDLTDALAGLAHAMRARGFTSPWRDEAFAVRNEAGDVLGTIERAAVRPLGIPTLSVYLAGRDPQGRHWIQRRAFDKATDAGLLDTMVGGGVPVDEDLPTALERETWEEAGLRLAQLQTLRHGGRILLRAPSTVPHGYMIEGLDWFTCVVPSGVVPVNQDGEVAHFLSMDDEEVTQRLERDEFTVDAAQVFLAASASSFSGTSP
ncbi:MAG TPA: NUDIX domain-containing protein [Ramlibacter sp.]|nr:NUDIX domain-containing protein [Ramlibacter sp.]